MSIKRELHELAEPGDYWAPYRPERWCGVKVMIDTNCVNARQLIEPLNQIEKWREDGVIMLLMPEPAYRESLQGKEDARRTTRAKKAGKFVRANSALISEDQKIHFAAIEKVLFPDGAKDENKLNDVEIVYESAAWKHILVTHDGDSGTQPKGILGSRKELADLDATVMRAKEAVEFIRGKIEARDARISSICAATKTPVPDWVGKD